MFKLSQGFALRFGKCGNALDGEIKAFADVRWKPATRFYLLVLGMVVGTGLGVLSILALSGTGIDLSAVAAGAEFAGMSRMIYPVLQGKDVVSANLVVFILGIIVSLYPAVKAARFTPVEAMVHA